MDELLPRGVSSSSGLSVEGCRFRCRRDGPPGILFQEIEADVGILLKEAQLTHLFQEIRLAVRLHTQPFSEFDVGVADIR